MVVNFRRKRAATARWLSWDGMLEEWQIPGRPQQQQAKLKDQNRGCIQDRDEQALFPQQAEIP